SSDLDVVFDNGEIYSATAFTYENVNWLKEKNAKTGECLSGKYFWSTGMFVIESLERPVIEEVVNDLLNQSEFRSVFNKIEPRKTVWVFNGAGGQFSGGIFEHLIEAENWISQNSLTGVLTEYPINIGVFDWAEQEDLINMRPEKLAEKKTDPNFIGSFTTASMNHYHYENGQRD
ncbi:MAG: hypothetical protein RIB63_05280, partial [Fulvivirga sp.]